MSPRRKEVFTVPKITSNSGPKTEIYRTYFKTVADEIHNLEDIIFKNPKFQEKLKRALSEKAKERLIVKLDYDIKIAQRKLSALENTLMLTPEDHLEFDFLNHYIGTGLAIKEKLLGGQMHIKIPGFKKQDLKEAEEIRKGLLRLDSIKKVLKKYELTK